MPYVLSLDLGTSSVRASLYDEQANPVPGATATLQHQPETDATGRSEFEADALVARMVDCIARVVEAAGPIAGDIAAVSMSCVWHSLVGVDASGNAVTPVILWADTRSDEQVRRLKADLDVAAVHQRTGCLQHTSYWPSKLLWLRENRPDLWRRVARWMSPGEYLQLRLLGRSLCGLSMASGTGLLNHDRMGWDDDLLDYLGLTVDRLNPLVESSQPLIGLASAYAGRFAPMADAPWFPALGDGACSNVGAGCGSPSRVALMGGTSGAIRVLRSRPEAPVPTGLWRYRWDREHYLIGGALSNVGNLWAWLRSTLRLPDVEEAERFLSTAEPDSHGLTLLPFLAGERCPGWRGDARAAVIGLSWSSRPEEILLAGVESVAYRFALIHELLDDVCARDHRIIATGGALLSSPAWMQILADVLGREVTASAETEASSRGAAVLALITLGLVAGLGDIPHRDGRIYTPRPDRYDRYLAARRRQTELYSALIGG